MWVVNSLVRAQILGRAIRAFTQATLLARSYAQISQRVLIYDFVKLVYQKQIITTAKH